MDLKNLVSNHRLQNEFPNDFLCKSHRSGVELRLYQLSGKITIKQTACFRVCYKLEGLIFNYLFIYLYLNFLHKLDDFVDDKTLAIVSLPSHP